MALRETRIKNHARVVVIGGGIAGCSILYHLTRLGWRDVALLEKGELTSGTTWHSVGNTPMFTTSLNLMQLLKYSNELYAALEAETGQSVGYHRVGSLRLASNRDLLDWYKHVAAMAQVIGVRAELISLREAKELNPLISEEGLLGVSFIPDDGYLDPSSVTHALAKGARQRGAEIYRNTRVTAINRMSGGQWQVVTDNGALSAEIVVNAAGQWGKQIGRLVGVDLPLVPLEHQYLVTEAVPQLKTFAREIPLTRDPARAFYLRQEGAGLLIGFFEANPKPWGVDGIPQDFNQQLLPPSLERIESYMAAAIERVPILGEVGIKRMVNGPDAYTPDGRCIMGYVPGVENFFVLAGFSCFGIANSGGAGRFAAEWIVEGQPSVDMWELDVRRFGNYAAAKSYLVAKACETYAMEYAVHYPYEERAAGRPIKMSPLYDTLKAQGAVYCMRHGWERPLWFAPTGVEPRDRDAHTLYRPHWFEQVGAECRAVRERVGVLDQTSFGKIQVAGPGAHAYLDRLCANSLPARSGQIVVTQLLNEHGGVECDTTVTRVADDTYWVITAAATTTHDWAWMQWQLPRLSPHGDAGSVELRDVSDAYGCLSLMGPHARDVLQRISDDDVSNQGFQFLTCRDMHIGAAPVRAYRVSYVGELGWELYHPLAYQRYIYARLMDAGREFGIVNFGYRALDSLRMEKGYRFWGFDMTSPTSPLEAGLERFVKLDKGGTSCKENFVGRAALLKQKEKGIAKTLACLIVEGNDAIPHGWEPLLDGEKVVGYVTSGEYGHYVAKTIAFAYLPLACSEPGTRLTIKILGERFPATVVNAKQPIYDPRNEKVKQ